MREAPQWRADPAHDPATTCDANAPIQRAGPTGGGAQTGRLPRTLSRNGRQASGKPAPAGRRQAAGGRDPGAAAGEGAANPGLGTRRLSMTLSAYVSSGGNGRKIYNKVARKKVLRSGFYCTSGFITIAAMASLSEVMDEELEVDFEQSSAEPTPEKHRGESAQPLQGH